MVKSHPRIEEVHEKVVSNDGEKPREVGRKSASIKSVDEPTGPSSSLEILEGWFLVPPRPLQRVISKLKPSPSTSDNIEPQISGSDTKMDPLIHSDGIRGKGDDWETNLEKYLITKGEILQPEA